MIKKVYISIYLILGLISYSTGEIIDGPANVRDTINGKKLFELKNDVFVECRPINKDWLEIGLRIKLTKNQAKYGFILTGDTLYNLENEVVGVASSDIELITGNDISLEILLFGITHRNNLKPESFIENITADYISSINAFSLESISSFIDKYQFDDFKGLEGFQMYYVYESWLIDASPGFRIAFVFYNGELQGIVHSREMKISGFQDIKMERGYGCFIKTQNETTQVMIDKLNFLFRYAD